jgi:2-desacetyl-2-hydroxyethyl bacteriochlorophyllide A dehydrogenase
MKALVLENYMNFVYKDVEKPKPKDGEVLIKIEAVAVCGSDAHGMDGSSGRRRPPIIMGHEAAGTIAELGENVEDYKVGDRVTFDSTIYCNKCDMCKKGLVNLCDNRRVLGVSCEDYKLNGAFAEYIAVPSYILYRLPDNVTFKQAAMVEPLSIAYHAATRVNIDKGASVAIVGVGTIGMLILQVVKAMGAKNIIAIDIDDDKLAMALKMGATSAVNSKDEDAKNKILNSTKDKKGVEFAFDATGIEQTVKMCIDIVSLNGKVVLVGNLAPSINFPLQLVVTRQLSLFGSCASAGEYNECIKLISEGKVDVESLISKTVPMSEGNKWITKVYNHEDGLNKIVMIP